MMPENNEATHALFVGQVRATLGSVFADGDDAGPVDVNVLTDGSVEVSFGTGWAVLDETAALFLADALLRATNVGRAALRRHEAEVAATEHAKAAFASLGLEWL